MVELIAYGLVFGLSGLIVWGIMQLIIWDARRWYSG